GVAIDVDPKRLGLDQPARAAVDAHVDFAPPGGGARTPAPQPQHVLKFDRADQVDHGAAHHPDRVRFVEAQGVHVVVADVLVPPSIQARTDRHRACRGLHRGALVAEAIMRCAQATVYDNSGSKGPRIVAAMTDGFVVGSPTGRTGHRRRIPRVAPMPGIAGHPTPQLAPGKVPMTTRIPRSAKRTAVTAPIPEAVREITRRWFRDSLDFRDQGRGW